MGFVVYASLLPPPFPQHCHGNKPPLELHLQATFAHTLHEVNRLLFPLSICFLSHSSSSPLHPCFNHFPLFFQLASSKSTGHITFPVSFFPFSIFPLLLHTGLLVRISKIKLHAWWIAAGQAKKCLCLFLLPAETTFCRACLQVPQQQRCPSPSHSAKTFAILLCVWELAWWIKSGSSRA